MFGSTHRAFPWTAVGVTVFGLLLSSTVANAQTRCPQREIHVLHAGTLDIDEFVVPDWAARPPIPAGVLVVEDIDHLEMGDATLTRIGSLGLWVVQGYIVEEAGDMAAYVPVTYGLLTTAHFDLTDDPAGRHGAAIAMAVEELLLLTDQHIDELSVEDDPNTAIPTIHQPAGAAWGATR